MTPERFQKIEELYHAARTKSGEERAALLAQADPELRREIESLLAQPDGTNILDQPAVNQDATVTVLTADARLGPYQIEGKLGQGGMGEVYRAVDRRLGRAVAIKTAHERFSARFEREARAISSLNHPNICTLYDVGELPSGFGYLVMELVEGETIAACLKRGPLPLDRALLYASQIAAALVEAHGKGIIHRDLKPGNIMIAKTGVKVLDFGVAKLEQDETITANRMVMGTPAYMPPEQREGKPADGRSDIYSFGCVLYEMVTGARVSGQRKRIGSRKVEKIVNRCLEEDPAKRWQSAVQLERELAAAARGTAAWKISAGAAAGIVAALAGTYYYLHRPPVLTEKDTIVLADFDNKTGDPVFDDTLRQGLSVELQQSPFLSLVPDQQVQATLPLMGQPKDARLTPEIARQLCVRTGSEATLEGSIASLGSEYVLGLRARNCNSGAVLDEEQIQAARREDVLNSLSQIARKFRTKVGESLATVEKHSMPLEQATTSSLEALKAYSTAMKVDLASGNAAAIPFFKRATEIDPNFAAAYVDLGVNYTDVAEWALARASTERAWELRDRVSDREKFFIDWSYQRQVKGNLEEAFQTLQLWSQTYPHGGSPDPRDLMAGLSSQGTGRWETVVQQARAHIAEAPEVVFGYSNLALADLFLDHLEDAGKTVQQAAAKWFETESLMADRYLVAFLKDDQEQMKQVLMKAKGKRAAEHGLANSEALSLARNGHVQQALQASSRAAGLAGQESEHEAAATYRAVSGVWESLYGNFAEAKKDAAEALAISHGRDVQYAAGLALAFSGELSRSDALADDLEKGFPEDTFVKFTYVPVLRAVSSLQRGHADDSIEKLQITVPYELAANGLSFRLYMGGLHSAYVRGMALTAARRYAEAAVEFQKILDHRGVVGADPIGALVHLQLGRTFKSAGDKTKAKAAYEKFLKLWEHADAEVPVLTQAKTEYANLK